MYKMRKRVFKLMINVMVIKLMNNKKNKENLDRN